MELADGHAIVHAFSRKKALADISKLDHTTTFVHVTGQLFFWVLEAILAQAPNLRTIQVIPTMHPFLNPKRHLKLCAERNVQVVKGHVRPEMAWSDTEVTRDPHFIARREMLLSLGPDAKKLFDELCEMEFDEGLLLRRYHCLDGEPYKTMSALSFEWGYSDRENQPTRISARVIAALKYLGLPATENIEAERRARVLRTRVEQVRTLLRSAAARDEFIKSCGVPKLPDGLPVGYYEPFKVLVKAIADGMVEKSVERDQRAVDILLHRFGLENWKSQGVIGSWRILEEIGTMYGFTRERARQLENQAWLSMGIEW